YTITYAGGSATVMIDQSQPTVVGSDTWVYLGTFPFNGPGSVRVTRANNADPNQWTLADSVKFSQAGQDTVVATPTLNSLFTSGGRPTTLAPGAYLVLAGNYAAFDYRYRIAANNIPVAGAFTGNLADNGEWVRLFQLGQADPITGWVPSYETDRVNYNDIAPWPTEADGNGPSLLRVHVAAYGNDPVNWQAAKIGGTPGFANVPVDRVAPSIPGNLSGQILRNPDKASLAWSASTDNESFVDHYNIYRGGALIGTATTTAFNDTTIAVGAVYSYQVSSVNRDGYESIKSAAVNLAIPGILSYTVIDNQHIEIRFNEPLNPATAGVLGRYSITGTTFAAVSLANNNTRVTLTTAAALVIGTPYTVTASNLTTLSGNGLPATQQITVTYAAQGSGTILREYWTGIGGNAVSDLTSNANYPNNPSGRDFPTLFEAPTNWADSYGTRMRGYVTPPTTGNYLFWIASDDNSELWLSTNDSPANKVKIAYVAAWTGSREWTKEANQQSAAISLVAGQRYYIEALQKEGGGGDNLAVGWLLPDGTTYERPIPGNRLSPFGGGVDETPPSVPANLRATLSGSTQVNLAWDAAVDTESGVDHYVVYRDGKSYGTATSTSFADSTGISSKTRHSYQVSAVNYDGYEGIKSAVLSVAPAGVASVTSPDNNTVRVAFTEPVTSASAQTLANYSISGGGVTITNAHLESDNYTVTLTTSALGTSSRNLTASNIRTAAGAVLSSSTNTIVVTPAGWSVTAYQANWSTIGTLAGAQGVIDTPSQQVWTATETAPWIDYVTSTHFPGGVRSVPGNPSVEYVIKATGKVVIPSTGQWSFDVNSDDGFRLTIGTNSFQYDAGRGATDSFATYTLSSGAYDISLLYFQGEGGHSVDVSAMPGNCNNTWNGTFRLIGDTANGGLAMNSSAFVPVPFSVGVSALGTGDTTPALGGTESDSTLGVTVRLANTFYAATPAGGMWNLPRGAIKSALTSGTYDISVCASNSSGQVAFDSTLNELLIDGTPPTASIDAVANPRNTPVGSVTIRFSEPVSGFDLADMHLTRNGGSDLITGAEILSTSDHITWTLSGLAPITADAGTYAFTVTALGSGIVDAANNLIAANGTNLWIADLTPPTATITAVSPDPRNSAVSSMTIVFSETVSGFDLADLTLKRDGVSVALTGATLTLGSGNTWTLGNLAGLTGSAGTYVLTLTAAGSGITDAAANTMTANASDTWVTDKTAPTVVSLTRIGSGATAVVSFSEPVTGVVLAGLTLQRDGATIPWSGATLTDSGNNTWTLGGLASLTSAVGQYTLTVAPAGIADLAGNALASGRSTNWLNNALTSSVPGDVITISRNNTNILIT
ncbi:MAG: Ig-like domain-containing protein, partial [Tepidisphaerales bacterium]